MDNIEFDFHIAHTQEQNIGQIRQRFSDVISEKYETVMQEVYSGWQGDNSQLFLYKAKVLQERMEHTTLLLEKAEEALHVAALKAERTEEKAKELGEIRVYD